MNEEELDTRMNKIMDDIESIIADGGERQLNQLVRLSEEIVRIVNIEKEKKAE